MEKFLALRKGLAVGIILLFVGACVIPATAQNIERPSLPASRGNILYVGGSGLGNYTRIQDAIDNASDGDTVFIYDDSSPYYENIEVNKKINLFGENRNTTVIDGGENGTVMKIMADNVSICGLNIQNSSLPQPFGPYAILLDMCSGCIIKNNIMTRNSYGIRIPKNSHSNLVSDNIIMDTQYTGVLVGDYWEHSEGNNRITNNSINESETGISTYHSSGNEITDNTITDANEGIVLIDSENSIVSGNYLENGTNFDITIYQSNASIVIKNSVQNSTTAGIFIVYSSNCVISTNWMRNNDYGIFILDSDINTIIGNNVINNTHGIVCELNSTNNQIYYNNFINNTINAYDNSSNVWNSEYPSAGNYWDNYTGTDAFWGQNQEKKDSDGIGDSPVSIPGAENQDRYPLMEPYAITQLAFGSSFGGFGITGKIRNVGNTTAFKVCWRVTLTGGFILLGRDTLRVIPKPLLPGEEAVVKSNMILGFGKATLTMMFWADNAPLISGNWSMKVLLFFIIGITPTSASGLVRERTIQDR